MGLFDLFRKRGAAAAAAAPGSAGERRFPLDRDRMFDLERLQALVGLVDAPREARDSDWSRRFFDAVWTASVTIPQEPVFSGPDGFPYLRLDLPPPGVPFDSQCLANVAPDCLAQHVGAALFRNPGDPPDAAEYVFSMGLIDSLLRYDSPDGDPIDFAESQAPVDRTMFSVEGDGWTQRMKVEKGHQVLVGTPSADYLPPHLAHGLHRYLTEVLGIAEPRVQLLADRHMRPHRSLVLGVRRGDFPAGTDVDGLVRRTLWYLNPGRRVMLMSNEWKLEDMIPLRELFEGR